VPEAIGVSGTVYHRPCRGANSSVAGNGQVVPSAERVQEHDDSDCCTKSRGASDAKLWGWTARGAGAVALWSRFVDRQERVDHRGIELLASFSPQMS
jgi:hypothetical protein